MPVAACDQPDLLATPKPHFMKKHDEYLSSSLWNRNIITDPYQTIAEFFSTDSIASYREYIIAMLKTASSNHSWEKSYPGDLLYYLKLIESIINSAFLLNKANKQSPLDIGRNDIFNPNLYCGWHTSHTEWDYFPRVLSFTEFSDPYLAFKHFFKFLTLADWKSELLVISEYALVNTSLFAAGIEKDMFPIYIHLTKLVEAAHLIDVREINHIGGHIKDRVKAGFHWHKQ
jgi:hypothetical protein